MTDTISIEKDEDVDVDIEENKEEIIESVAKETGLNNSKDRLLVKNAVNNLILDREFEDENLSEYQYSETSIVEDIIDFIKGGKVITEGEIVNISKTESYRNELIVTIKISETGDTFTESFYYDDSMSEELKSFFALVGVKSGKPSDLVDEKVPINNIHQGDGNYNYEIQWPPKSGLLPKMSYKMNRIARRFKFVGLTENDGYDFKYKPTLRLYTLLTIVFAVSLSLPIFIIGFIGFAISCSSLFLLFVYHMVVLLETYDLA